MIINATCYVCGTDELVAVEKFEQLPRVTSDCKPFPAGGRLATCHRCGAIQKPADATWRKEIGSIYDNYDIYYQSMGVEQSVFNFGRGTPRLRSQGLLEHVHEVHPLGTMGVILDVGCGKGTFLQAFAKFRPNWRSFGHELSRKNQDILARIPTFERLYTTSFAGLPGGFDVVALIHALEHFEKPVEGLRQLKPKLTSDGIIVVQVPNP